MPRGERNNNTSGPVFWKIAGAGAAFQAGSSTVNSATIIASLVYQLTGSVFAVGLVRSFTAEVALAGGGAVSSINDMDTSQGDLPVRQSALKKTLHDTPKTKNYKQVYLPKSIPQYDFAVLVSGWSARHADSASKARVGRLAPHFLTTSNCLRRPNFAKGHVGQKPERRET